LLFRRGQRLGRPALPPADGGFKTKIDRHCDLVTINVFYKNSRLKQYLNYLESSPSMPRLTRTSAALTCS
jgi:hypothetical protein